MLPVCVQRSVPVKAASEPASSPVGAYRYYALAVLTAVYMVNLIDRGIVMLLLQPIKEDLSLSDTQMGLVTGIAFGLFYATMGVPIARWADHGDRVKITSAAIGLWGVTVMACLFVTNYAQLIFARMAAAVGEAGCKPPTYSLIGDYFPRPAERARAMAIYSTAASLATLISFSAAGVLNELYGWRVTFFLAGIPGLLLAVLVKVSVVEPRTIAPGGPARRAALPSLQMVLRILWQRRSCRHLSIALILLFMMSQGLGPWYASFLMRNHGMGTAELGVWLGLIFGLSSITGLLVGGVVVARWFADNERVQMRLSAGGVALFVPFFVAFVTLPNKHHALIALMLMILISSAFLGPVYALMQRLVPDEMRATSLAIVMLFANLIGMGAGPLIVGALSDLLTPSLGKDALRCAMLALSLVTIWAGHHFWLVSRFVTTDLKAVREAATW